MAPFQTRRRQLLSRQLLLSQSAPEQVRLFSLPPSTRAPVTQSLSQSAFDIVLPVERANVRFPWAEDEIDLTDLSVHLPVNIAVTSNNTERNEDDIQNDANALSELVMEECDVYLELLTPEVEDVVVEGHVDKFLQFHQENCDATFAQEQFLKIEDETNFQEELVQSTDHSEPREQFMDVKNYTTTQVQYAQVKGNTAPDKNSMQSKEDSHSSVLPSDGTMKNQDKTEITKPLPSTQQASVRRASIMDLPTEILQVIFEYVVTPEDYEIKRVAGSSELTHWRYRYPRRLMSNHTQHGAHQRIPKRIGGEWCWDYRASHMNNSMFTRFWAPSRVDAETTVARRTKFHVGYRQHHVDAQQTHAITGTPLELEYVSGATAFLMACRRFYLVGTRIFYEQQGFSISGRKLFDQFLRNMTDFTLPWLRSLYLYYEPPGEPQFSHNLRYRDKEDERWIATCKHAASVLTGLKFLDIYILLKACPPQLSLGVPWASGVLEWRAAPSLEDFRMHLRAGPVETDKNRLSLRMTVHRLRCSVLGHAHWEGEMSEVEAAALAAAAARGHEAPMDSMDPRVAEMKRAQTQVREFERNTARPPLSALAQFISDRTLSVRQFVKACLDNGDRNHDEMTSLVQQELDSERRARWASLLEAEDEDDWFQDLHGSTPVPPPELESVYADVRAAILATYHAGGMPMPHTPIEPY